MNKETIENRITELRNKQKQLSDEFAVCEGAVQDCQFWLKNLETPTSSEEQKDG